MCGIAGIIGDYNEGQLDAMLASQHHRGPDATGKYLDSKYAALGHNRLAIIDLSVQSNQPFVDNSGRYLIVFNGEIYNYIELKADLQSQYDFKTESDTEVLLAAFIIYGASCLGKCNGMFAFTIWDNQEKKLFAARDRFGVKPFYYAFKNQTLYFSSEIKALHAAGIPKIPNEQVWASYFAYGSYGMPDETFWSGIAQLPGGHFMEVEGCQSEPVEDLSAKKTLRPLDKLATGSSQYDKLQTYCQSEPVEGFPSKRIIIKKWYCFEDEVAKQPQNLTFEQAKEKYVALLKDSVNLRFRADVAVGFNVSGGLDSSVLLALVNLQVLRQAQNGNFNPDCQSELVEGLQSINAYTFYTNNSDYDELPWVEKMIAKTGNPLTKVLLQADAVPDFTQKITWQQDEPFGGIPTLAYAKIFEQARKDKVLVLLDGQGMDEQWAGYDYYTQNNEATIQGVQDSPYKIKMLSDSFLAKALKPVYPKPFEDEVLNKQYRDLFYTKIPRALRFNDRISMAFSTELREPFLDYRLVEFAFSLPLDFKIRKGQTKWMLREIASGYLADDLVFAPKRALQTPQREWLARDLAVWVSQSFQGITNSSFADWFNKELFHKELQLYLAGNKQSSFHIWQLINWYEILGKEPENQL
ncbi:asparagine synthase (glutamine-hydrolyzing) [Flavobacterium sp.]|uniref:asparagine synthase (glutamine-hydrolyzing) n=1 Tax=Flavobacterium sp. TaxID=239 RepID=UPI0025C2D27D|nr:asparagine synthase (glutamine-hydrolyzing) [Flavobacterium sp.]MBA4277629.1 asparagine synthase (glutamine-hydrolyzing) [Flavobacterium sp.]